MALIQCPECGKEISDKAAACIHCGCPMQPIVYRAEQSPPPAPVATGTVTQGKSKRIIAAILAVIAFVMTFYASHFQNQEVIYMVKSLSGGMLVYLTMFVCVVAATLFVLPSHRGFKASCSVVVVYSLIILLCQIFLLSRFSFAVLFCLMTMMVIISYPALYCMSVSGSFSNTTPLMISGVAYIVCIFIEMTFAARYGTSFSTAYLSVMLPTILFYVGSLLYIGTGIKTAYAAKKVRANSASTQYQAEMNRTKDGSSTGYAILCFCFPIVGLILYCVWRESLPQRAKSAGLGGLIGFAIGVVLTVLSYGWLMSWL